MRSYFWTAFLFLFIFNIGMPLPAYSKIYDWVPMGRDDIQVIVNPKVEFQLRIQMIRQAKDTLDLVTYDQRPDETVGMPLVDALEEAAIKGVKIRFATAWMSLALFDPFGHVKGRLKAIASRWPNFQYRIVGGPSMVKNGWKEMDGLHEKLMIIDGKWALTTGRGNGEEYLKWLDTGFAFKGALVRQSAEAFDQFWMSATLEGSYKENVIKDSSAVADLKNLSVPTNALMISLSPVEVKELQHLSDWLLRPESGDKQYKARVLYHDFLNQMRNTADVRFYHIKPGDYTLDGRFDLLQDPVVEAVIEQLDEAKSIEFTTLAVILHPKLLSAFKKRLQDSSRSGDPFQLLIFTNSKRSHKSVAPIATGWYASLPHLDEILQDGNSVAYKLKHPVESDDPIYLHRKLIVIRHDRNQAREDSVIFGSHNLSLASTVTLDEMSFQIEGTEFADKMDKLFQDSLAAHGDLIDKDEIHSQLGKHPFMQWLSGFFKWTY